VFDWMTFDQARGTMDETFQAAIATYDPRTIAIVYVILLSKTGNSVGVWRKKLKIPSEIYGAYRGDIEHTINLLSEKRHICAVETMPDKKHYSAPATMRGLKTNSFVPHSILRNPAQNPSVPSAAPAPLPSFAPKTQTNSMMNTAAASSHPAPMTHMKHASAPASVPTRNVLTKDVKRKDKKGKDKAEKKTSWVGRLFGAK